MRWRSFGGDDGRWPLEATMLTGALGLQARRRRARSRCARGERVASWLGVLLCALAAGCGEDRAPEAPLPAAAWRQIDDGWAKTISLESPVVFDVGDVGAGDAFEAVVFPTGPGVLVVESESGIGSASRSTATRRVTVPLFNSDPLTVRFEGAAGASLHAARIVSRREGSRRGEAAPRAARRHRHSARRRRGLVDAGAARSVRRRHALHARLQPGELDAAGDGVDPDRQEPARPRAARRHPDRAGARRVDHRVGLRRARLLHRGGLGELHRAPRERLLGGVRAVPGAVGARSRRLAGRRLGARARASRARVVPRSRSLPLSPSDGSARSLSRERAAASRWRRPSTGQTDDPATAASSVRAAYLDEARVLERAARRVPARVGTVRARRGHRRPRRGVPRARWVAARTRRCIPR